MINFLNIGPTDDQFSTPVETTGETNVPVAEIISGGKHRSPSKERISVTQILGCHRKLALQISGEAIETDHHDIGSAAWKGTWAHKSIFPEIAELSIFSEKAYYKLFYEQRVFTGVSNGVESLTISGSIDLLAIPIGTDDEIMLIDFKTTAIPANAITDGMMGDYARQIALYKLLLNSQSIKPTRFQIWWLHWGETARNAFDIMELDEEMISDAVTEVKMILEKWFSGESDWVMKKCKYCKFVAHCPEFEKLCDLLPATKKAIPPEYQGLLSAARGYGLVKYSRKGRVWERAEVQTDE